MAKKEKNIETSKKESPISESPTIIVKKFTTMVDPNGKEVAVLKNDVGAFAKMGYKNK